MKAGRVVVMGCLLVVLSGCMSMPQPKVEAVSNIRVTPKKTNLQLTTRVHDFQFSNNKIDVSVVKTALDSTLAKVGYSVQNISQYTVDAYCLNVDYPIQIILEGDSIPHYTSSALVIWKIQATDGSGVPTFHIVKTFEQAGLKDAFVGSTMMRKSIEKALRANVAIGVNFVSSYADNRSFEEAESLLVFNPKQGTPSTVSVVNINTEKEYQIWQSASGIYHCTLPAGLYCFAQIADHQLKTYKSKRFFEQRFNIKEGGRVYELEGEMLLGSNAEELAMFKMLRAIDSRLSPSKIKMYKAE